jgi:hypothetical protein
MRLRAVDPHGLLINYTVRGLPSHLSLGQTTGRITGRARRTGTFAVHVSGQDSEGSTSSTDFSLTVGGAPHISRASVFGLGGKRPRVSFTVTAGRSAPAFQRLSVSLPSGLKLASTRGVTLKARGVRHPRFSLHLSGGTLQIGLRHSLSELSLTLSRPAVQAVSGRRAHARARGASKLTLSLVDTGSGTSRLQTRLAHAG